MAGQFIDGVDADHGTLHMPALRKALSLNPEVIFLLTDADSPLGDADLNDIEVLNKGRARIHCIEFSIGPELTIDDNFLKKLARRNGGNYRYRDVTNFSRR